MKEFEVIDKMPVNVVDEKQQEKKVVYMGGLVQKRGHTLFEVDTATGEIREAVFDKQEAGIAEGGEVKFRRTVKIKPGCIYKSCLNKKSAKRHFDKYREKYGQ